MTLGIEIEEAVSTARKASCRDLVVLHCFNSYSAVMDQAKKCQVPELVKRFDVVGGLSAYTMSTTASLAVTTVGACLIKMLSWAATTQDDSENSVEPAYLERVF